MYFGLRERIGTLNSVPIKAVMKPGLVDAIVNVPAWAACGVLFGTS